MNQNFAVNEVERVNSSHIYLTTYHSFKNYTSNLLDILIMNSSGDQTYSNFNLIQLR